MLAASPGQTHHTPSLVFSRPHCQRAVSASGWMKGSGVSAESIGLEPSLAPRPPPLGQSLVVL